MRIIKTQEQLSAYDVSVFPRYSKNHKSKTINKLNTDLVRLVDDEKKSEPITSDKLGAFFR